MTDSVKLIERLRDRARQFFGHVDGRGAASEEMKQAAALIEQQAARIAEYEAARFAYASEFGTDEEGVPDVGSIHANIRTLKARLAALESAAKESDSLLSALAECRDAFPIPESGGTLEGHWLSAMANPEEVPAYVRACLAAAPAATDNGGGRDAWQPIETAPEGVTVVVGWMAPEDGNLCSDFDWLEDGVWQKHTDHYEWAYSVAPAGSRMPSDNAPYTHWMPLPELPAALSQKAGEKE